MPHARSTPPPLISTTTTPAVRAVLGLLALFGSTTALCAEVDYDAMLPPVDRSESRAAHEALVQARRSLVRARLDSVMPAAPAPVPGAPALPLAAELRQIAARAITRYNNACRPILSAVHARPEFYRMSQEQEAARKALRKQVETGASVGEILATARHALKLGQQMTYAEMIALASSPAVEDARIEMNAACTALKTGQPGRTMGTIAVGRGYGTSPAALAAARQRVEEANRRLADALTRESLAELARDEQVRGYRAVASMSQVPTPTRSGVFGVR